MSKVYNKTFTSLKTATHDTGILDAQKILIKTPNNTSLERADLFDYAGDFGETIWTTTDDGGNANTNLFVLPANIFPADKEFNAFRFNAKPYSDNNGVLAYLGVALWDKDGNKIPLGISGNSLDCGTPGTVTWIFDSFTIPADNRLIFYILENKEDFILPDPTVKSNLRISVNKHNDIDPYTNWSQVLSDINVGFHFGNGWSQEESWDGWPVCAAVKLKHIDNSLIHLSAEQSEQLDSLKKFDFEYMVSSLDSLIKNETYDYETSGTNAVEWNGIKLPAEHIPYNKPINFVEITATNTQTTPAYIMVVNSASGKEQIGISKNTKTWSAGDTVHWEFENTFTIEPETIIEAYITSDPTNLSSEGEPNNTNIHIGSYECSGGARRYGALWYSQPHGKITFGFKGSAPTLKTEIDNLSSRIETNANDISNIQNELTRLDNADSTLHNEISSVDTKVNELSDKINSANTNIKTYDTNHVGGILDNATVTGIQYSMEHFVEPEKQILSISFPYSFNSVVNNVSGYLAIELLDANGEQIGNIIYSSSPSAFASSSSELTFNFSDFTLPADYKLIRMALVANNTTDPDITSGTNCLNMRVRPIKSEDSFTFDTDGCEVYNGSNVLNWLVAATVSYLDDNYAYVDKENIFTEANTFQNGLSVNGAISTTQEDGFILKAASEDGTSAELCGKNDGTLTWNGTNVLTTAGGALTGDITINGKSAVTTTAIQKAQNGYVKFSNGLIIQWGYNNTLTNERNITLPTAFTSTNYSVTASPQRQNADSYAINIASKTTSSITVYVRGGAANEPFLWIAIGY